MKNVKIIAITVAATIVLVLILQNLEPVTTRIIFQPVEMPLALLLAIVALIAYVAGVLTDGRLLRRKRAKTKPDAPATKKA